MALTYTPIATTTGNGSSATITFSSIPSTYTDLILVQSGSASTNGNDLQVTFNNDTASNYSRTYLLGDGTSASSGRSTSQTSFVPLGSYFNGMMIMQIQNYSNTTTYKTALVRGESAGSYAVATVGLWRSTAAINRIDLTCTGGSANWSTTSTFTLYGIKASA